MASELIDCDCGFIDWKDPTQSIFTNLLVVNFTSATNQQLEGLFILASYDVSQPDVPYIRNYSADQLHYSSAGLDLTVSPSPDGENVPCAQIITKETSFFYGSYRTRVLVGDEPGTVAAFYSYKNDSSEIDIEYLSAWTQPTLLYTVKPQIYSPTGNPDNSTYQQGQWTGPVDKFREDFHEWSWTWLPDIVHFGIDSNYSRNITTNVPQAPGRIALNHWSNGDPNYSLGPPTQNTTFTVSFLQAIYNDTSMPTLACQRSSSACLIADGTITSTTTTPTPTPSPSPPSATHINAASQTINGPVGWLGYLLVVVLWWLR
ncbi:hypothetical protein AC579_1612 [Pseudocercospora musae]|uniref:GH16 domain-containing protein n=1 Tax=Pseudocercospora musae TaxID=113226 RepID=A0A139HHL6_9PEZI|nr:hypothetical protein AC579_1612 [Pseudocercospora musae]